MAPAIDWLPIWQLALAEPIGLLLRTNDPTRAKAHLYRARADSGDERLSALAIRTSPFPDGDLLICRGTNSSITKRQTAASAQDLDL